MGVGVLMRRRSMDVCFGFGRVSEVWRGGVVVAFDLLKKREVFRDRKDGLRVVGWGGDVGIGAGRDCCCCWGRR